MRESLGTVRLHRFTCDQCGTQVESKSKASGPIPLPSGWASVSAGRDGQAVERGEVCSAACAEEFVRNAVRDRSLDPKPGEEPEG